MHRGCGCRVEQLFERWRALVLPDALRTPDADLDTWTALKGHRHAAVDHGAAVNGPYPGDESPGGAGLPSCATESERFVARSERNDAGWRRC